LPRVSPSRAALSAVTFAFDREDRRSHHNSFTFFLTYEGVWPRQGTGNEVKVDVTLAERLAFPLERRPVLRGYPEFSDLPADQALTVYSLGEIAAEKAPPSSTRPGLSPATCSTSSS
jgi:hypothetical protein